ncbi:ABC transporter ATP-binding protein [Asticcacaulis sp. MM231]|uniref:ABC transporter ATP-binding protein n=1 Tax=Asticcacaulis sp. MM231 TaxID=3157666 RepID=UPI0032D599BE
MPLISLKNLEFTYETPERRVEVLRGVSLDIEPGEFVAICGPSGCGKSTLLNILGTLERPSSGQYIYDGDTLDDRTPGQLAQLRAKDIGFVFQSFNLIDSLTVYDNIELALLYRNERDKNRRARIMEAMDRVGIAHRANHLPRQLSGGQQQRCAIARAIVGRPAILLADEPTGNLDSENAAQIFGILKALHLEGSTLVVVTHSPSQADQAERVVEMLDGRIQFTRRRLL